MAVQSFAGQANVLLGDIFGHNSFFSTFITNNPVLSAVILVILLVFLIGAPLFFMDMIVDIWKVPFAVVIDLVVFFAYSNSSLVLPAIAASFLIFILLVAKKNKPLAWTLGLISALATSTLFFFEPTLIIVPIIAFLPINTALMLIGTVLD